MRVAIYGASVHYWMFFDDAFLTLSKRAIVLLVYTVVATAVVVVVLQQKLSNYLSRWNRTVQAVRKNASLF